MSDESEMDQAVYMLCCLHMIVFDDFVNAISKAEALSRSSVRCERGWSDMFVKKNYFKCHKI